MKRIKHLRYIFILHCFALLLWSPLLGQHVKATLTADTNAMLIGDHLQVELSVIYPSNFEVNWPQFTDSLGRFEVLEAAAPISSDQGSIIQQSQKFTLTVFDSGSYQIPPIPITYGEKGQDSLDQISLTQPIAIEVATVAVDTTQAIKPIKDPDFCTLYDGRNCELDRTFTINSCNCWRCLLVLEKAEREAQTYSGKT